jgi:DNA-binding MarR family transcriptional regulator
MLTDRERRGWYGFLLMEEDARRRLNRYLTQETGLTLSDYAVLSGLSQRPDGSLRVHELRDLLYWEKTRLTHQLSRMVSRGLLERRPCPEDGRGTYIGLTQQGREVIDKATPLYVNEVRRVFLDVITPRQLDTVAAVSEAVLHGIQGGAADD